MSSSHSYLLSGGVAILCGGIAFWCHRATQSCENELRQLRSTRSFDSLAELYRYLKSQHAHDFVPGGPVPPVPTQTAVQAYLNTRADVLKTKRKRRRQQDQSNLSPNVILRDSETSETSEVWTFTPPAKKKSKKKKRNTNNDVSSSSLEEKKEDTDDESDEDDEENESKLLAMPAAVVLEAKSCLRCALSLVLFLLSQPDGRWDRSEVETVISRRDENRQRQPTFILRDGKRGNHPYRDDYESEEEDESDDEIEGDRPDSRKEGEVAGSTGSSSSSSSSRSWSPRPPTFALVDSSTIDDCFKRNGSIWSHAGKDVTRLAESSYTPPMIPLLLSTVSSVNIGPTPRPVARTVKWRELRAGEEIFAWGRWELQSTQIEGEPRPNNHNNHPRRRNRSHRPRDILIFSLQPSSNNNDAEFGHTPSSALRLGTSDSFIQERSSSIETYRWATWIFTGLGIGASLHAIANLCK